MHVAWFQWGGAATAAVLALLTGTPIQAADDSGVRPVAGELGQRTKAAAAPSAQSNGGLSDSAVRVLMTYAFSLIPEEQPGPDGKPIKIDKSDPNKFLIPADDARRIIRAATRSAYAEACELPDLAQANYKAMMSSERARNVWDEQQLLMVNALHLFSASYFSGNVKISDPENDASGVGTTTVTKGDAAEEGSEIVAPKRPQCPPEQKQKVMAAINAFVKATPAAASPPAAAPQVQPAAPVAAPAPN
jgi:hypothetical protein